MNPLQTVDTQKAVVGTIGVAPMLLGWSRPQEQESKSAIFRIGVGRRRLPREEAANKEAREGTEQKYHFTQAGTSKQANRRKRIPIEPADKRNVASARVCEKPSWRVERWPSAGGGGCNAVRQRKIPLLTERSWSIIPR